MKKSIANHVASTMDSLLVSDEYKSLFNGYKVAQANPQTPPSAPTTPPGNAPAPTPASGAPQPVKIDPNWGAKPVPGPDVNKSDDECDADDCQEAHDHNKEASLTTAIDSLLTASAALDMAGDNFAKIAQATLVFAAKLVDAKKAKPKAKKDDKKDSKKEDKSKSKEEDKSSKKLDKKEDKKDAKKDMKKDMKEDKKNDAASKKSSKEKASK